MKLQLQKGGLSYSPSWYLKGLVVANLYDALAYV